MVLMRMVAVVRIKLSSFWSMLSGRSILDPAPSLWETCVRRAVPSNALVLSAFGLVENCLRFASKFGRKHSSKEASGGLRVWGDLNFFDSQQLPGKESCCAMKKV